MNLLYISAWYPYPPDNGIKLRIFNLIKGLASGHNVTLLAFVDQKVADSDNAPELRSLCSDIHVIQHRNFNPTSARALLGLLSPTPRVIIDTYEPRFAERIQYEINSRKFDLVIASEWEIAAYWRKFSALPAILDDPEFGLFESEINQATSFLSHIRHSLTLIKLKAFLRRMVPYFSACTVVSEVEGNLLRRMVPGYEKIKMIPNCVNLEDYPKLQTIPQPDSLIFPGSFRYSANYDAMMWFVGEVLPLIQVQVPNVRLYITGDNANLPLPPAQNVFFTGFVNDFQSRIASSWICLAPIRFGGGTRLKILESMALLTPVVATSKGAEGLNVNDGEHLLIGDTPQDYAEAVIRLLKDKQLRKRLSDNAYYLVRNYYNWQVVIPRFLEIVEEAVHNQLAERNQALPF